MFSHKKCLCLEFDAAEIAALQHIETLANPSVEVADTHSGLTFILSQFYHTNKDIYAQFLYTSLSARLPKEGSERLLQRLAIEKPENGVVDLGITYPYGGNPIMAKNMIPLVFNELKKLDFKIDPEIVSTLLKYLKQFDEARLAFNNRTAYCYHGGNVDGGFMLPNGVTAIDYREFVKNQQLHRGYIIKEPAPAA